MQTELLATVWRSIGGEPAGTAALTIGGPEQVLPSVFDVTGLAAATVGAACLAVAELFAARTGEPTPAVHIGRRAAAAAFVSEALFTPLGWQRSPVWDPIAGDYRASDGWIKLHTNYRHHRAAVEQVIGTADDRSSVAAAVARWSAAELQDSIVDAGGCAAAMNTRRAWLASAPGQSSADELPAHISTRSAEPPPLPPAERPLSGVRVLDLTRVIAGPVCTRFLAAHGADVLRIDPQSFDEVPALVPETSAGKHCARLDLTDPTDRAVFGALLREAHVLVTGLRPGALDNLGYDRAALRAANPSLIVAALDAYGWSGPWAGRRGFDSLVQMSSGIAVAGSAAAGADRPVPLPAQALDHGTGYLLAAAVGRALTRLLTAGLCDDVRCSLVATANVLVDHPVPNGLDLPAPAWSADDTEPVDTGWGPARRVPVPGRIDGLPSRLPVTPGPLGRHAAAWEL